MNKKIKQLKKLCQASTDLVEARYCGDTEEKYRILEAAEKKYKKALSKVAKKLLKRAPTDEELATLVGDPISQ